MYLGYKGGIVMVPQVFRWWPIATAAGGLGTPGAISFYTDPLNTEGIAHLNVMLRMDMPYYGPLNSLLRLVPEVSMDGTRWESLTAVKFGDYSVGNSAFEQKHFSADNLKRFMRYQIEFENDMTNTGIQVATFDLTGIGRYVA